jgi:predicted transcriptional regulator
MLFAGEDGAGVFVEAYSGNINALQKLRDMIAVRLSDRGLSHQQIAIVLGVSRPRITQRLSSMPDEAKRFYRRVSLG